MRISFDLDDTLICYQNSVPREPNKVPFIFKPWIKEPLRLGSVELIHKLQSYGFDVCIYTSSFRSPILVRLWLCCYKIKNIKVINQKKYNQYLEQYPSSPRLSKNPKLFEIDYHVDDSIGVKMEGDLHGFSVIVISPEDREWIEKVLDVVVS